MAVKRTARTARKHEVKATLGTIELTKAGTSLDLDIYANKEKLGTLILGRGSLYWYGANRQKSKRVDWTRFAKMMDELAYGK